MHNVWLIARREYLERVTTKAFIVSTVLIPVLMGGFVFGSFFFDKKSRASHTHIAIVSTDTQLGLELQRELESTRSAADTAATPDPFEAKSSTTKETPNMKVEADLISPPGPDTRGILDDELDSKSLDGYLWIAPAANSSSGEKARQTDRLAFTYTPASSNSSSAATRNAVNAAVRTVLLRQQLAHHGLVADEVASLTQPVAVKQGKHKAASSTSVAYVLFFLMYMVVMLYGMNVARSIIEEKTSRVFEVLLATIRPEEMMAGKILGVGSVGLTQVAVWMLAALVLSATSIASSIAGGEASLNVTAAQIIFFILYFIFGFVLYSSMAAALGAMTNSEQELQQLNMFLVMPLAFCMLMLPVVTNDSNSFWSRVVSLIPFCSPLLMNFRISLHMPQPWEIALSFVLMSLTIYAVLWVASRIYRVGVLMYGKRPTLPELLRWLKYS
jgi:ABC-2 type transport system permease protein